MALLRTEIRTYLVEREVPCVCCGKFFTQQCIAVILFAGTEQLGEICPTCFASGPKQKAKQVKEHVARMQSQAGQMRQEAARPENWTAQARERAAQLESRATALLPLADCLEKGDIADLRVLVVDNNKDVADGLVLLVRGWGHDAQVVYDGSSALPFAYAFQPHVLLLDLGMQQVDVFALAQQLRQLSNLAEAILIAVTGHGGPVHHERGEAAGFDHYLVKPVAAGMLESLLKMVQSVKHLGAASDTIKAGDTMKIGRESTRPATNLPGAAPP